MVLTELVDRSAADDAGGKKGLLYFASIQRR